MFPSYYVLHLIKMIREVDKLIIYKVFFAFSFFLVMSFSSSVLALSIGSIDDHGLPTDVFGHVIVFLVNWFLDIQAAIYASTFVLTICIIPQIITYVLCGLFGVARPMKLILLAWKSALMILIKGFVSAGGVVFGLALSNTFIKIDKMNRYIVLEFGILTAILMNLISFVFVWIFLGCPPEFSKGKIHGYARIIKLASKINEYATKYYRS